MTDKLSIALAQLNPVVGDIPGNLALAKQAYALAARADADLIVFSELFLTGYPPEDLVLKRAFAQAARQAAQDLAKITSDGGPAVLIGTLWPVPANDEDAQDAQDARDVPNAPQDKLYNAVVLLAQGKVAAVRFKTNLPNYGVFDEKRVFDAGTHIAPVTVQGVSIGVPICEDIWQDNVCGQLAKAGAEFLLVPNGSPFDMSKPDLRRGIAAERVRQTGLTLAYVNQIGGQDELVFDGASFVLNPQSSISTSAPKRLDPIIQLPAWQETVVITQWSREPDGWQCASDAARLLPVEISTDAAPAIEGLTSQRQRVPDNDLQLVPRGDAAIYHACVLGLRDYVNKTGFPGVVLGLSGGIDSALVAAMAVDALGSERVHCIMLPYRYTSQASLDDARDCAKALRVRYDIIEIEAPVTGFHAALESIYQADDKHNAAISAARDIARENIQSRSRGVILMAVSNMGGAMVLTTGNKSELSVGYATLYGDMNGGFNPIKDLYKLQVYALARWRNSNRPELLEFNPKLQSQGLKSPGGIVIPCNIIAKAPSAELREDQTDQDSLPPYETLDDILWCLVEEEMPLPDVVARGHDKQTVETIEHLLYVAEYKRRQGAPGVKISQRNYGRDRRYPIVNKFREPL